jgi:uncharacterized FlaG/YvyC family protein
MPKLHELLAVESNLSTAAQKTRGDLIETFHKKRHLFQEKRITYTPLAEGAAAVTEAQSDIQSTVVKEIGWISEMLAKAWDVAYQIDIANTKAVADVVDENGTTLLKAIPATALLQLEKRIAEVRDLAVAIPTLDPAQGFSEDAAKGAGIYQARPVTKQRTKKVPQVLELAPATKEHARQTQVYHEDVPIGTIQEQEWSAMLTPATKSDILTRCDMLLRAVRKARAKANEVELEQTANKIGKTLLDYVFQPLAPTNGNKK